jgi:hypothetical protein
MMAPRQGRTRWLAWIIVALSATAACWALLRPIAVGRRLCVEVAPAGAVGSRWAVEWTNARDGSQNGAWVDVGQLLAGDGALEFRPSGTPDDPARRDFSLHVYEVRSAGWALRRPDLRAALAAFRRDPARARAAGWEFQGEWIAGIESSGIIYRGLAPGVTRVPVPASAVRAGIEVESERTPSGGQVDLEIVGQPSSRQRFSMPAPKWEALTLRVWPDGPFEGRFAACRALPNYPLRSLSLRRADAGAEFEVTAARIEFRLWGFEFGGGEASGVRADSIGGVADLGGLLAAGPPWWCEVFGAVIGAAAIGGAVLAFVGLARMASWLACRVGSRVSQAPAAHGPARLLATRGAMFAGLGVIAGVRLWMACWSPVLVLIDSAEYIYAAQSLAEAGGFAEFGPWRAPGLPALLAPLIALHPWPETVFCWLQAGSGVLVAWLVYDLVRRAGGPGWGLAAMLVVGLDPVLMGWERHVMTEAPAAILVTASGWALVGLIQGGGTPRRAMARAACVGLLAGGAALVRADALVLVVGAPVIVAIGAWRGVGARRALILGLLSALSAGAVLGPWVVRQQARYGTPEVTIGRGAARAIFAWYAGALDANQSTRVPFDTWRRARGRPPTGDAVFAFMYELADTPSPAATFDERWLWSDREAGPVADESRSRLAGESAAEACRALASHLGFNRLFDRPSYRNTDYYMAPLRGLALSGGGTNWARPVTPWEAGGGTTRVERIQARTIRDVRGLSRRWEPRAFDAWYLAAARARWVFGVVFVLGLASAAGRGGAVPLALGVIWLLHAGALSGVPLRRNAVHRAVGADPGGVGAGGAGAGGSAAALVRGRGFLRHVPAAAQGLVQRDHGLCDCEFGLDEQVLAVEELALVDQGGEEVADAALPAGLGEIDGAAVGGDGCGQVRPAALLLREAGERVLGVFEGHEHGAFEGEEGPLFACAGDLHARLEAPARVDGPPHAGPDVPGAAAGIDDVAEVVGLDAGAGVEEEPGVEVGGGDADAGGGGGDLAFGAAQVRAPPEQVGGHADGDAVRGPWDGAHGAQFVEEALGREAQEDRQAVGRLVDAGAEWGQLGLAGGELGACLLALEVGGQPRLNPSRRQAQRAPLGLDGPLGQGGPLLEAAEFGVVPRDLRDQHDEGVARILEGGVEVCVGGLNAPAEPAEHVDLP